MCRFKTALREVKWEKHLKNMNSIFVIVDDAISDVCFLSTVLFASH